MISDGRKTRFTSIIIWLLQQPARLSIEWSRPNNWVSDITLIPRLFPRVQRERLGFSCKYSLATAPSPDFELIFWKIFAASPTQRHSCWHSCFVYILSFLQEVYILLINQWSNTQYTYTLSFNFVLIVVNYLELIRGDFLLFVQLGMAIECLKDVFIPILLN